MFSKLTKLFQANPASSEFAESAEARLRAMIDALGAPCHIDRDASPSHAIDIYVFERNFVEECDTEAEDDEGYILVTSGMSDYLMTLPEDYEDESPAVELIWYVRELNAEYFANLRWLAKLPAIDKTWFGMGHTVPMPAPPLSFCPFSTFLFLPPIIRTDRELLEDIDSQDHSVEMLAVHVISSQEYALIKTDDGLGQFLDLLDDNDYPLIFDPSRLSIVE